MIYSKKTDTFGYDIFDSSFINDEMYYPFLKISNTILPSEIGITGIILTVIFILFSLFRYRKKISSYKAILTKMEDDHRKSLQSLSLDIAEQERSKIATDIHDEIGMMLHVIKQNISKTKRNLHDIKLREQLLSETDKAVDDIIIITRNIAYELALPPLINIGFIEGIFYLCDEFNSTKLMHVEIKTKLERIEIDKKKSVHLYRLVKEIMNNTLKHSKAQTAEIEISVNSNFKTLVLIITHDGIGVDNATIKQLSESSQGAGLRSIMDRAQLILAKIEYIKAEKTNPKIIIEIPL